MKKLLYIASICIASLFSACDDYLTVESPDQLTSSSFWRNQSDACLLYTSDAADE